MIILVLLVIDEAALVHDHVRLLDLAAYEQLMRGSGDLWLQEL